ncbi:hypothetical protein POM88_001284 [Heracleum sosnowskyi]|uniref:Staygreen protein domain-containing protein n=1 Tax=Heracleum sosnowskyi TaxID=360622 RepID=A0AAD8JCP6_9APIA|nr:hypothetical protein POM88_001284 [Heracleum sosnowskyi]
MFDWQLKGWYNKDDVVAQWTEVKGDVCLDVHCYVSGPNSFSELTTEFRYHIFSKELPLGLTWHREIVLVLQVYVVNRLDRVESARFVNESVWRRVTGVGILRYSNSKGKASGPLPEAPQDQFDKTFTMNQARSIRWNVSTSDARPNPQGSF